MKVIFLLLLMWLDILWIYCRYAFYMPLVRGIYTEDIREVRGRYAEDILLAAIRLTGPTQTLPNGEGFSPTPNPAPTGRGFDRWKRVLIRDGVLNFCKEVYYWLCAFITNDKKLAIGCNVQPPKFEIGYCANVYLDT